MYQDAMQGVCDSDNLLVEVATAEDCTNAQVAANSALMYGIALAFGGIIGIIIAVLMFLGVVFSPSKEKKWVIPPKEEDRRKED